MESSDPFSKPSKFYVYTLCSYRDKGWYIGFTKNLKERLIQHAKGQVASTRLRTPLKLMHYEYFIEKSDAKAREVFLKSGYGRTQLKSMLKRTILLCAS